jgi:carboxyl-terminal processing protease
MNNNTSKIILPVAFAIVLIGGFYLGSFFTERPAYNVSTPSETNGKLSSVVNYVQSRYVDSINDDILVEAAIPAMLQELDPHSVYIPSKDLEQVSEPLQGNFEGIGISFNMQNDTVIVISTITGGPSERVGIMPGDRFIKVNDTLIAGVDFSTDEVIHMLKGPRGTKVTVEVKRKNVPDLLQFDITRDKIPLYSVDVGYMINDTTGYIKISRFAQTTFREFVDEIKELKSTHTVKNLVLDLRGNNGGYMTAATNIADQFLEANKLIVYTEGKASPRSEVYSSSRGLCKEMDVAVLIDEWSASASEILAGAIQDNDRGTIIGRRSFGKGLVQEQTLLTDGSAIRLTVARYYTPTGRSIQKPYSEDREEYYNDLNERFINGEFSEKDSIHFADSLKYQTPGGKIVYGGGGIMPDVFVPFDTTRVSKYYGRISAQQLIYRFAFNYADDHRKTLNEFENVASLEAHLNRQALMDQFTTYASEHGISKSTDGYGNSKEIIHTQLKAYIARNILDNEGFYPIIRSLDNTVNKAIEVLANNNKDF